MSTEYYNLDQVSFTFCGVPITGGYGEGGSITIKRNAELYTTKVGRSGDVVRSRTNDKSGIVELTLLQTSGYNAILAAVARRGENSVNGSDVGPLNVTVRETGDVYAGPKAWIQKLPDVELGKESTDRTWTIACSVLNFFPGGRPAVSP